MNYARVTYPQQVAGNKNFTVPFQYLSRDHIKVTVNGNEVSFTWLNSNTVSLLAAPMVGDEVEIRRLTSPEKLLVQFSDGSVISETDLRTLSEQTFFLVQEAGDLANETAARAQQAASRVDTAVNAANTAVEQADTAITISNMALSNASMAASLANSASMRADSAEQAAISASGAAVAAAEDANTAVVTAAQLEQTVNQLLDDVQALVGDDLTDFAKNSDNLASLVNKEAARENIGLGNVDNTSDMDKPVSTATQAALDAKANLNHNHTSSQISGLTDALAGKANTNGSNATGQWPINIAGSAARVGTNNWAIEQEGTSLIFRYNGTIRFRLTSAGTLIAAGDVSGFDNPASSV